MSTFRQKLKDICGIDFINNYYDNNNQLKCYGTGNKIWEGSLLFNKYLLNNYKDFEGKNILEIAAGIGSGGLSLAKYNINYLAQTDIDPECLIFMKENIKHNKEIIDANKCYVSLLNYGKTESLDQFFNECPIKNYDIVLACDPIFIDFHVQYMMKFLDYIFIKFPKIKIVYSTIKLGVIEMFLEELEKAKKYNVSIIEGSSIDNIYQFSYIFIVSLKE